MKLHTIDTGFFKLDGGAMFGVVPKVIWNKLNPADENNLCTWAMRCLLIEKDDKLILIDTGMGNKQSAKFFSHYHPHGNSSLEESIRKTGFRMSDITDVILTHLHFDHCGGAVRWNDTKDGFIPTFPNAVYWLDELHLNSALNPNPREKASFLSENILPLIENKRVKFVNDNHFIIPEISFYKCNGHTESMLIPIIEYKGREIIFCADLIPSSAHLPLNFVMGYDIRPLNVMNERKEILVRAVANNSILFFEHDKDIASITVMENENGRTVIDKVINISEI
ncbi:MAG: MBL fold metallo-hydrolase [Bacteroidetes bacterium]|nr:MBL fold metallo-hydrolase [Bacteroidota bacterium]